MTKITLVLQESDAARVRKAICVAGGDRMVLMPLPSRLCGMDMLDIQCEKAAMSLSAPVRLDVVADDGKSGSIVSAILCSTQTVRLILVAMRKNYPAWRHKWKSCVIRRSRCWASPRPRPGRRAS